MASKLPQVIAGMAYLDDSTMDWEHQTPKSRRKILKGRSDLYISLVQWDAGFGLPVVDHHGGEELLYIVKGTFVDQNRESGPGTFIRCDAGTSHQPSTPDGCTFVIVREITEEERQRLLPQSKL
jgi:anti-sigma factor ChrR (cupin superfamily)